MNNQTPDVSIVVPTFNEAGNIEKLVALVETTMGEAGWEIIVVDDDSPDGTWRTAKALARGDSRVRAIRRVDRRGLAGACIEGALSSSAPNIVVMDADLQHDERILPELLAPLRRGEADLVIGTRAEDEENAGFSARRAWASRFATTLARRGLRANVTDPMSGFFAIRRDLFEDLAPRLTTAGFKLLLDILATARTPPRVVEVTYSFRSREEGSSKFDARVMFDFAALLVEKVSGGLVPVRFLLFAIVGASGVAVHLLALRAGLTPGGLSFGAAQTLATFVAMTTNFFVNNLLTYRDKQLRGAGAILGLLKFYAVCSLGAVANVGLASWLFGLQQPWWLAGVAGTLVGSIFNYAMSTVFVWRR